MNRMVTCARSAESAVAMGAAFDSEEMLGEIRADYEQRHK
jgi:hypothetical protein